MGEADFIETEPLDEEQLRTLAEDCILQLRRLSVALDYGVPPLDGILDHLNKQMGRGKRVDS